MYAFWSENLNLFHPLSKITNLNLLSFEIALAFLVLVQCLFHGEARRFASEAVVDGQVAQESSRLHCNRELTTELYRN